MFIGRLIEVLLEMYLINELPKGKTSEIRERAQMDRADTLKGGRGWTRRMVKQVIENEDEE